MAVPTTMMLSVQEHEVNTNRCLFTRADPQVLPTPVSSRLASGNTSHGSHGCLQARTSMLHTKNIQFSQELKRSHIPYPINKQGK